MCTKILSYLRDLDSSSADIEASALVSVDGLVMASTFPLDMEVDHIGAICAGTYRFGHRTSEKCASGELEQMLIKCAKNQIVMAHAGTETILAVIIKPYANFEQLFSSIKYSIERIALVI